MESGMDFAAQSGAEAWNRPRGRSRGRPCSRACMRPATDTGTEAGTRSAARHARCPLGFSEMQIAILSVLKAYPQVIAYWEIAESVTFGYGVAATEGMVRGALERLLPRGFLVRTRAARGKAQGNRYKFAPDPCPYISPYGNDTGPDMEPGTESAAQSGESAAASILKEKRDRQNLSISSGEDENRSAVRKLEVLTEDDIAFHWPNLARAGFGTCQIRQIIERLAQVNIDAKKIIQGLTYAEWELERGTMRDKSGQQVTNPVNWVFLILAKQGYYRRPEGYISPQEQAELDDAREEKQIAEVREARKKAACAAWVSELSPEERSSIVAPPDNRNRMPEDTALRLHFTAHVWPEILAGRLEREGRHEG